LTGKTDISKIIKVLVNLVI